MDSKCWWNSNFESQSRNWEHEAIEQIDEVNGKSESKIIFTWSKEMRKTVGNSKLLTDLLLIGSDASSSSFLDIQHQDKVLIGSIIIPEVSQAGNSLRSNINNYSCNIYKSTNFNRIIVLHQYERSIGSESLFWWTNQLFRLIESKRVVVFDTISDHKIAMTMEEGSDSILTHPQLRYLSTGFETQSVQRLDAPHIVQHVAASILTYCQIHKIESILFLSITNNHFMEAETLKAFEKALDVIETKHEALDEDLYEKRLYALKTRSKNPLYI
jgi:hypothetical protein